MLPQKVPSRQRHNIILFNEPRGKRALASSRLPKHQHPQELPLCRTASTAPILRRGLAGVPEGERKCLLGCGRTPEGPLEHALHVPAPVSAGGALAEQGGGEGRRERGGGAGEENGHAEDEGGEKEEAGSVRGRAAHGSLYACLELCPNVLLT